MMKVQREKRLLLVSILCLAMASCGGQQSVVDAAGVQAERLESLWWLFFYVTLGVYVVVMAVVIAAFIRRASRSEVPPDIAPDPGREQRVGNVVKIAVALTVFIMFMFMIVSFRTGKAMNAMSTETPQLAIKVTGHQWWWEVEYQDEHSPGNNMLTANEIHIPVGRPVKLMLQSNDVIHSLWMPNMHGKKDLVPIYPTTFYFQADKPGMYWGQCAEFCGYQHAKMRFWVVAESDEDFKKWIDAGRLLPAKTSDRDLLKGQEIFTTGVCAQCHTVNGTPAGGRVGPNLTHIASRPFIAAGSLENNTENLKRWITDPQAIKPGIRMPMNQFSEEDLNSLVKYLQSLK